MVRFYYKHVGKEFEEDLLQKDEIYLLKLYKSIFVKRLANLIIREPERWIV